MRSRRKSYLRRNKFSGQFAGRLIAMLQSPAYRVLSLSAHRLLARIEIELAKHGGDDNGKLPATYEQFVEYGIHRHSIAPAIRECEALGFLEAEHGQAGNREYRWPSMYRLTYHSVGRARPTDEWRRISTIEEAKAIVRAARKQKTSAGKRQDFGDGNRHRKPDFSVTESVTTVPMSESVTTSRLSGSISPASASAATPPRQSAAHAPPKGSISPASASAATPPRQSAAHAPPKGRHKRGPVLMRGSTPASPDATNETLTTARGGSAHQKEENGQ